ncbi:MAG: hypothetical protein IJ868_00590 [Prevotella sp.]|nr:hypothetical protein [Prevotella sp.]
MRSNKSKGMVWMVTTEGWEPKYCRNARTALKYIFLLKKSTGGYVSRGTIEALRLEIALSKKEQILTM